MATIALPLIGGPYIPTTSLTGNEPVSIFRGANVVIRGMGASPYIESYAGHKDLNENYDLNSETLTGTLAWTAGSNVITGTSTLFDTELRPGQWIIAGTEVFVVNSVESDTSFIAERAPETTASAQTARWLYRLFEVDRRRGVLRRGNAIVEEHRDILFVGDGKLFLNGSDTGFTATQRPKRLHRQANGTFVEHPVGFPDPPIAPLVDVATGGAKGMISCKHSFMFSWWNSHTKGYSNPSVRVKKNAAGTELTVAADGRFSIDVTALLADKPTNADGIKIWGTLSSPVSEVATENFSNGALYEVRDMPFAPLSASSVDTANDEITITDHKFQNGDSIFYIRSGGTTDIAGLTSGNAYYVLVKDANTIQLASSVSNFRAGTAVDLTATGDGVDTFGYFNASNVGYFEYLNGETGQVASGNNYQPPECEWVAEFANRATYISCLGARRDNGESRSFGNFVMFAKDSNRDGAPVMWATTVGDPITGFAKGAGRLFCQTPTGIFFITPTGRTEIARLLQTPTDIPFTSRPFWSKGGVSPYNLTVLQADVYYTSGGQPLRSPTVADDRQSPFEIGKYVRDILDGTPDGHILTVHDPKNQQVCFILSGIRKNSSGYWESEILPLDLSTNPAMWQPPIKLSSTTRDMIVSGAAVVNNRLEFLAGGRVAAGNPQLKTYRYDERNGSGSISYYVVFQPTDNNEERRAKFIKSLRVTGRFGAGAVLQIHGGSAENGQINIANIENGTSSLSGDITLTSTGANVMRQMEVRHLIRNLAIYSVRLSHTWTDSGTNSTDRFEEVVINVGIHGQRK